MRLVRNLPFWVSVLLGLVALCVLFLPAGCGLFESTQRQRLAAKPSAEIAEKAKRQRPGFQGASQPSLTSNKIPTATYSQLRAALTPYGKWLEVPVYGKVWKPAAEIVGKNWVPFTHGRWVYTDWGWLWVSVFERWGWAAFHFGRFALTPTEGWVWFPSLDWSPATVAWRESENFYGWGALPPGYSVAEDVLVGSSVHIPREVWVFIEKRNLLAKDVYPYLFIRLHRESLLRVTRLVRSWKKIGSYAFYTGPRPESVIEAGLKPALRLSLLEAARKFGTRVLPPKYPEKNCISVSNVVKKGFSEIRPDTERALTVVGPNSPKRLPPRKIKPLYIPPEEPKSSATSRTSSSRPETTKLPSRPAPRAQTKR